MPQTISQEQLRAYKSQIEKGGVDAVRQVEKWGQNPIFWFAQLKTSSNQRRNKRLSSKV